MEAGVKQEALYPQRLCLDSSHKATEFSNIKEKEEQRNKSTALIYYSLCMLSITKHTEMKRNWI